MEEVLEQLIKDTSSNKHSHIKQVCQEASGEFWSQCDMCLSYMCVLCAYQCPMHYYWDIEIEILYLSLSLSSFLSSRSFSFLLPSLTLFIVTYFYSHFHSVSHSHFHSWQYYSHSITLLSDLLESQTGLLRSPPHELREICLKALQLALETRISKLVALATSGFYKVSETRTY